MPLTTSNDEYVRPYGVNAPWNIPVEGLQLNDASDDLAELLWNDGDTEREFRDFNINNTSYTYPVYEVSEDTPYYTVNSVNSWANIDGEEIPFDPSWQPAPGSDAQIIILDPATGMEWNLHKVDFDGDTVNVSNGSLVPGSYFENEEGWAPSRGAGIQYLAMLVRPEEIEAGVIEHALSMPVNNTSGVEYYSPATKIEYPDHPDGIPEGTRFSLDVTEEEIDAHLASLPDSVSETSLQSLRVIMVAMKDYGWFITDTSGGTHIQLEAMETAGEDWERLGLAHESHGGSVYPRDALDGLITQDRLLVYVPSDEYDISDPPEDTSEDDPIDVVDIPPEDPPAEDPPAEDPPAEDPPAEEPPAEDPPAEDPPAEDPPAKEPPAEDPPAEEPPAEDPPAEEEEPRGTPREAVESDDSGNFLSKIFEMFLKIFGVGGKGDKATEDTTTEEAAATYDTTLADLVPVTGMLDDDVMATEEEEEVSTAQKSVAYLEESDTPNGHFLPLILVEDEDLVPYQGTEPEEDELAWF